MSDQPIVYPHFGQLEVISEPWIEKSRSRVRVRCSCGTEFVAMMNGLKTGNTTSCGCKRKLFLVVRNTTHGHAQRSGRHPLYRTWADIIQRCENENHPKYADYGGRGISVCSEWRQSFAAFLQAVGERPFEGAEIDRRDNNGNYDLGNVRWATREEQMNNTRVNTIISHDGKTMSLTRWARHLGWSFMGLKDRVRRMPLHLALVRKDGV